MKKIFLLSTLLLAMSITMMGAVKKTKLRVLYVGGHSNLETFATDYDKAENERSVKERTASFEQFLGEYFTTVKVVMADDYNYKMSYDYDVPRRLRPPRYHHGRTGRACRPPHGTEDRLVLQVPRPMGSGHAHQPPHLQRSLPREDDAR